LPVFTLYFHQLAPAEVYTLSLHDALPILRLRDPMDVPPGPMLLAAAGGIVTELIALGLMYERQKGNLNMRGAYWHILQTFIGSLDRKSTRLNSSHVKISYAVFCLKKKMR